ncbi:membrane protein insertion efficiency factor YidD [Schaalia sp. lx-260]|uniref:membrane protein insertion efficiency factor YidD n=1 Tax=Schaalia sp. lx-260 TaxID=2899082 RepID=UPI001E52E4DD|nr:membrane protein insertion efficiency factor YidD [Schaalia sp. lx-260]MCD4550096.1 membrane protein insertion efficiency factor YidD [Schaalia sp. lx-260]
MKGTSFIGRLMSLPIVAYQRFISPAIPPRCRYAPTCSAYAVKALHVHGPIKGILLAVWRLLRCNPWSLGGVDHVPDHGRWKPDPWIPPHDWPGNLDIEPPQPMGLHMLTAEYDQPIPMTSPEHAGLISGASRIH